MAQPSLVGDIDTPAVVVDLDVVERNLARFQDYCDRHGLKNRPHIKTHKIVPLARRQLALGAAGITCQKLGEAEVMADAGIDDILVTYNILGRAKLERLAALARRIAIGVTCDDAAVADGLAGAMAAAGLTLPVLVECDTGAGRCGVQSPEAAIELARHVDRLPGLSFAGFMTFPKPGGRPQVAAFLDETVSRCRQHGLEARVVSSGGTPDMMHAADIPCVTEYRAGTYIYNDRSLVERGACGWDDCALTVRTTVASRPTEARGILDAGSKTLSSDTMGLAGFGHVLDYPEAVIERLNEEHATVDFSLCPRRPRVGEVVGVVPNHACVVSNLFDRVHAVRGGRVEAVWAVDARGRVA